MTGQEAYEELLRRASEAAVLNTCSALLQWEEQTYMPRGGVDHRGNQLALVAGLIHERRSDPRWGELLDAVEASDLVRDRESEAAVNARELRRVHNLATKLPRELVRETARTISHAVPAWTDARRASDFSIFLPWLEKIIELKRQEANCLGFSSVPYDALLDEYEPGATTNDIRALFESLRTPLVELVTRFANSKKVPNEGLLRRDYPIERQKIFVEWTAAALGFDFHRGRLDTTAHPFCTTLGPSDCRITTRYNTNDFSDAFFSVLHEVGHGLYEQGLGVAHFGTPMGEACSLGVHESQSRLWENAIGRGRPFWNYFFPMAHGIFPSALRDVSLDDFLFAVNTVRPSLNRVESDEVTYNLHILIRFELEQELIHGNLPAKELPTAWNQKYTEYLGVTPTNDREGCLQDIHWSEGLFGYFPTYTLGNLFAAQLVETLRESIPDLDTSCSRGEFRPILEWLREKVHRHGQRYRSRELVERVTGKSPSQAPLLRHLGRKFDEFYA